MKERLMVLVRRWLRRVSRVLTSGTLMTPSVITTIPPQLLVGSSCRASMPGQDRMRVNIVTSDDLC